MTTSPLKVEDSRAQFEEHCEGITGYTPQFLRQYRKGDGYAADFPYSDYWWTWQASRAAIVVELPLPAQWDICEVLLDKGKVAQSIRAAGITVKGDS